MTASDGGLYKILIIGGGPAGIGLFVRAARTGFLQRLLDPSLHGEAKDVEISERLGMKQKGVAIVHDGDASTFGSGNLGQYVINSNTFARSLLSSVLDEKPDLDPPESIKNTFLERAKDHETTRRLESTGNAPACLVDFGNFLCNVGACLMKEMSMHAETSKCLLNTKATRFEKLKSGIYRVDVTENDRELTLYSEHLVLAMGGVQQLPSPLQSSTSYKSKLFSSDECLREDGFQKLRDHLLASNGRKVCIVGGSHSAFSVAWLLLNKGKTRQTSVTKAEAIQATDSEAYTPKDGREAQAIVKDDSSAPLPENTAATCVDTDTSASPQQSSSTQKATPSLSFQPRDITIIHRSPIRCYYMTRKEAEADGADGSRVDRTGCVNTFTGLREDSKHLYKDVRSGRETRVRLFLVNQHGCQNVTTKAYETANAIVWCCGYETRMVPGCGADGKPLQFQAHHGVVQLDMQARLLLQLPNKSVVPATNLFGMGLGFSLRSHVDEMGTETRADGVTVYHRRGATLILAALFGSEVFGSECQSFEEMVEKNDKHKRKSKEASAGEGGLMDRVKSSNPSAPLSAAVPSASTSPVKTSTIGQGGRISPEKKRTVDKGSRMLKQPVLARESNNPEAPATNPPVKMLLQRRRSTDTLHVPRSARAHASDAIGVSAKRSGSESLPKAALLRGRPVVDQST